MYYLYTSTIDLPRKVKYRPRYKKPEFKIDKGCRIGRSYNDFRAFIEKYIDLPTVQMDSVIGSRGGKILLTIHFVGTSLMLAYLTDNGSEFSNPKAIEYGYDGLLQTQIFCCDPSSPHQKGAIEVNHELIRRILPKGTSFDSLTQGDISLVMNHVNSYKRKKLNNRSPYQTFSFYYGEDLLNQLGRSPVAAGDIILKPKLFKK